MKLDSPRIIEYRLVAYGQDESEPSVLVTIHVNDLQNIREAEEMAGYLMNQEPYVSMNAYTVAIQRNA